jgi:uncharacterized protein YuzE
MVFQYFPESGMLYIKLSDGISIESEEIAPGVVLDFNATSRVIGIEIEDAAKYIDLTRQEVSALPVAQLILTQGALTPA